MGPKKPRVSLGAHASCSFLLPLCTSELFPSSHQEQVARRDQPGDHRPKSSYVAREGSPQSPRDKRPLSGPNIRTPNLPITEGVMKTAQQTARPFNTYPRTDSEGGRSPTGQVGTSPQFRVRAEPNG